MTKQYSLQWCQWRNPGKVCGSVGPRICK